jgi:hypothetical protein
LQRAAIVAGTALVAAARIPRTPGTGMRRSPYRCTRPMAATEASSPTGPNAGRITIAQNTSVP